MTAFQVQSHKQRQEVWKARRCLKSLKNTELKEYDDYSRRLGWNGEMSPDEGNYPDMEKQRYKLGQEQLQ